MYQVVFLGTSSAGYCEPDNFQSNFLIKAPSNEVFLVDCGGDVRRSLHCLGYDHLHIDDVYISHLHSDHIGGLEWLALMRKFDPRAEKPTLYVPTVLQEPLWEHSLKGGLTTLREKVSLDTYFNVVPCSQTQPFAWQGMRFTPFFSYHAPSEDGYMPCFGLWIETEKTKVFFSSDSLYTPDYNQERFERADIIFHDCETTGFKSGVHAHYSDLLSMPKEIKEKTRLYHCHDYTVFDAKSDGFFGYVPSGEPIIIE